MNPFKLTPTYKDYLWGGTRLKTDYGKHTQMQPLAESWEVSTHLDGPSVAASGLRAGETLASILGDHDFPLLIKLIDAEQALSIQVHPDDCYAREKEGSVGKTEMWYVLDAAPDSFVYYGVKHPVTEEELRRAVEEHTFEELLKRCTVRRGDVIFIPAGTLHAIGAGVLLYEVQQNSNLTYRVYDYGRMGADGKQRELHVEKALEVATLTPTLAGFAPQGERVCEVPFGVYTTELVHCAYFTTRLLEIDGCLELSVQGKPFEALVCIEGEGELCCAGERFSVCKGESVFVPADAEPFTLCGKLHCVSASMN